MLVFFCTNVLTICVTYGEPTERGFQPSLHPMQSFRNLTRRSSAVCVGRMLIGWQVGEEREESFVSSIQEFVRKGRSMIKHQRSTKHSMNTFEVEGRSLAHGFALG